MRSLLCQIELDERRREISETGTDLFPISAFYNDLNQMPCKEIPWHWHKDVELIYIDHGSLNVSIQQDEILLQAGEGLFINTNILHAVKQQPDQCIFYSFVFSPELISGGHFSIIEQNFIKPVLHNTSLPYIPFTKEEVWQKEAASCIFKAFEWYEKGDYGYEIMIREKLSHMWYLIATHLLHDQKTPLLFHETVDSDRIKKMMEYIHQHYQGTITLNLIAESVNISEREALRCFQKILHLSPIAYVMKFRISKASELLRLSDHSITEVSSLCGFNDPSYFTKVFKDYMKESPKSFKKRYV